jgi:hypothetical protein
MLLPIFNMPIIGSKYDCTIRLLTKITRSRFYLYTDKSSERVVPISDFNLRINALVVSWLLSEQPANSGEELAKLMQTESVCSLGSLTHIAR